MDVIDIVFRLVGVFYAFGGMVAIRTMVLDAALDRALAMITLKPEPARAIARRWLLGAGAVLTGVSGVALAALSQWAVPLFLVGTTLQIVWLFWARHAFPPEDADDARGRRQTTNAALGYAIVLLGVVWLANADRLAPLDQPAPGVAILLALIAFPAYLLHGLHWPKGGGFGGGDPELDDDDWSPDDTPALRHPSRIRLVPSVYHDPLVDADDGRILDHFDYLPLDLAERIEAWRDAWVAALDPDTHEPVFANPEAEAASHADAGAIVSELEAIYGEGAVEAPEFLARRESSPKLLPNT